MAILLLMPRKTALTSPATTEDSTVPPSLFSTAHPRIPSPLRAKTPGLQREPPLYRCPCVLLLFDLSHALALPTCPPAGDTPFATTTQVYQNPLPTIQSSYDDLTLKARSSSCVNLDIPPWFRLFLNVGTSSSSTCCPCPSLPPLKPLPHLGFYSSSRLLLISEGREGCGSAKGA
jgi:hypothetical protein